MEWVRLRREELGLTQHDAAGRAGISVPTWYRIETDSAWSGRSSTVEAVERVLRLPKGGLQTLRSGQTVDRIAMEASSGDEWFSSLANFAGSPWSTPRLAFKLVTAPAHLADDYLWKESLDSGLQVGNFRLLQDLPDWVLFMVNDYWLDKFRSSILQMVDLIQGGDSPALECVAEEVALWLLLKEVRENNSDFEDLLAETDPDGSILPINADREEDWDGFEESLFDGDLAFTTIWDDNFPGRVLADPGIVVDAETGLTAGELHPFRWWEPRPLRMRE